MNNKLLILCLALAVTTASLSLLARPVRGTSAEKSLSFIEDSAPENLWSWPTAIATKSASPSTVWVPEIGVWYGAVSLNGYFRTTASPYGDFTESSVSTKYYSGYSLGTFLPLEKGHYVLKCNTDGESTFSLTFYREVENGYLFQSYTIFPKLEARLIEQVFSVPEGADITLLLPTTRNNSAPPLTVTDIEIYRLD